MIRRNISPKWRRLSAIGFAAVTLYLALLLCATPAAADLNVEVIQVQKFSSYTSLRVYAGRTLASRVAQLGFKQGGEIDSVLVNIGDRVSQGQKLASLDTLSLRAKFRQAAAEVSLAKANVVAQEANTQLAQNTERRFRKLREQGHAAQQTYDEINLSLRVKLAQLNVARANLERAIAAQQAVEVSLSEANIIAPFTGTIQSRLLDEGSQIRPGEAILRLVEEAHREAHIGVPASLSASLYPGTTYTVRWNNSDHAAILLAVLPEIDPATRTHTAVFKLLDLSIPLGAVVELTHSEEVPAEGYWLPLSALTEADRGLWGVYVINSAAIVERRLVEIVHSESRRVFVRGTLSPNDNVVATGVQRIVPGQKVAPHQAKQINYAG